MARATGTPADDALRDYDTFRDTPGKDVVYAFEADYRVVYETIFGLGGGGELHVRRPGADPRDGASVLLYGGDGADLIEGFGASEIVADGGTCDDRIEVRAESVDVLADSGDDRVAVGAYGADVYGGAGNDLLDVISFPSSHSFVDGGAGNDTLLVGQASNGGGQRIVARGGTCDGRISAHPDSPAGTSGTASTRTAGTGGTT
jgi:Ca2+-binding RTX toxin-like protein